MDGEQPCPCCKDSPGLERGEGGHTIGRDPRQLSRDELAALGHKPMSAQQALRFRCVDCCSGNAHEVKLCTATRCPAWPFRLGVSPFKQKRRLSDEQREALRQRGRQLAQSRASLASDD